MFSEQGRDRILKEFDDFLKMLPAVSAEILKKTEGLDEDTALAMKFLYANMPVSDVENYSFETYLDYAARGVRLWNESPFVRDMPEEIFMNDVLYHRVNEEEIRPCRTLFGEEISGRISGMDMKTAVFEVNYWCAETMTYRCSDDRTSSALACYEKGYGRCGEESVLAVNAYRSVGIPARQVYAPKWSHCDDNHAWVEVWCDGEWHYLGACEPEPVLDKGWFTGAASRAMMVHSRCFERGISDGAAAGESGIDTKEPAGTGSISAEEPAGTDGICRMENQLRRYAPGKTVQIYVENPAGTPVPGAKVSAEVLNYAEFAPVAKLVTDSRGGAELTVGLGSLHIMASYEGAFGECLMDTRGESSCYCVLNSEKREREWLDFDMAAPAESLPEGQKVTGGQEAENERRCAEAFLKRKAKTEAYRPRWKDEFLPDQPELAEEYMSVLSEKDREDADPEILREHYEESLRYEKDFPREIFLSCVWNPRAADEVLSKWRRFILEYFSEEQKAEFRQAPEKIWSWIQGHFRAWPERERLTVYTVPAAALKLGIAQPPSRKVLFTAIARTLGIPARLNPEDQEMEYWRNNGFCRVLPEEEKTAWLTFLAGAGESWIYFQNWSLGRLTEDGYRSLALKDADWKNDRLEMAAEPGVYRVLTANRLPNGNIFAGRYDFKIEKGGREEIRLKLREARLQDMLDSHSIPDYELTDGEGQPRSIRTLTEKERRILCWLDVGKEPTEHILNEMAELKESFGKVQHQIVFILRGKENRKDPTLCRCRKVLPEVPVYYDTFGKDREMTARQMYVHPEKLPLLVVTDGVARGIFACAGYSVGMADMLLRVLKS